MRPTAGRDDNLAPASEPARSSRSSQSSAAGLTGSADADGPRVQAVRNERLLEYHRMVAACQTVPGDPLQVRLRLLDLATQKGVVGAATDSFEAGSRQPSTLSRVVSDAMTGDLRALTTLGIYDIKLFGVTRDQQDAARYALKLISADPTIGPRAQTFFRIAESYGAPNSHFDFSRISPAARALAEEIAQRSKARSARNSP